MIIDTHCHSYSPSMLENQSEWLERMKTAKIAAVLLPNIDLKSILPMHQLVATDPQIFYPMMGLHPCDVNHDYQASLNVIRDHLYTHPNTYCAVGEIGLDYYWDTTYQSQQIDALKIQLDWAIELDKPVSVHARKSLHDLIPIMTQYSKKGLKGVMHCFSGSLQDAQKLINMGYKLGIGGVVTYPKAGLAEILREIPISNIVLETDAPYLPPVPHRGKTNESSYLTYIAQKVAEIYELPYDEVCQITTQNALDTFGISLNNTLTIKSQK